MTEALFPSYLFARFEWHAWLRAVHHAPGVAGVVHFGDLWPTLPDQTIESLRATVGEEEIREVPSEFAPGDQVRIAGGAFHGLEAVVQQAMPGRQRVMVLLDFLGRQSAVEVPLANVVRVADDRATLL